MVIPELVADTIAKNRLLNPGQRVIVGVSGGADSLCLMACLNTLGYQVVIAHLDHQLRTESAEEAQYVKRIGDNYGILTIVEKGNVFELADRGYSLEEAARLLRYRFLVRVAKEMETDTISTGHTADDQVETVLMHLLRGAGPSGLRGILLDTKLDDWVDIPQGKGIHLVRPLLETRRSQTEAYCKEVQLKPIQDPSNLDPSFFRNKIRHHLIPLLKEYNPGIENIILRMASVMEAETQLVDDLLKEKWRGLVLESDEAFVKLSRNGFEKLPVALQRSFVRRIIKWVYPEIRDIGFEHIERAVDFLSGTSKTNRLQLLAGLEILLLSSKVAVLRKECQELSFLEYPQVDDVSIQELPVPSQIEFENGWILLVGTKKIDEMNKEEFLLSLDDKTAALDVDQIKGLLHLRTIQPGDRIQPLGMDGNIKVSELFINSKIPQPARRKWPLIVDDEKIIWVVGLRIADECRITSKTREIIFFQAVSPEENRS